LEIEEIRGVQSAAGLRTLQDRELIEPVGRAEGLGRPLLYGTTRRFLEHFGFDSLEDLPRPDDLPVVLRSVAPRPEPGEREAFAGRGRAEPSALSVDAEQEAEELHLPVRSARDHAEGDGEEGGHDRQSAVSVIAGEGSETRAEPGSLPEPGSP
jgi:hypothetical protein